MENLPNLNRKDNEEVLDDIIQNLAIWNRTSNWWNRGIALFGILTIVTSVLVSVYTATNIIGDKALKILACTSTASLTLLTAFNAIKKGNDARRAWRILNAGLYRYKNGIGTIEDLIKCYELGESLMGDVDFSYGLSTRDENGPTSKNTTKPNDSAGPSRSGLSEHP